MTEKFETEAAFARLVVAWLAGQDFDVYQEVQIARYTRRADIVATRGPLVVVVECKMSLGLALIEQAAFWTQMSHMTYVAVPLNYVPFRSDRGRFGFACKVARRFGLGVLTCHAEDPFAEMLVRESERPEFRRRVDANYLRERLAAEHKTFAEAGNANGKFWTPFQATSKAVADYARAHPGVRLKDVVDNVKTHYSTPATARACIVKWATDGKMPGVRLERDGRAWTVWAEESKG